MPATWQQKQQALREVVSACLRLDEPSPVLLADGTTNNSFAVIFEHQRNASTWVGDVYATLRISSVNDLGHETRAGYVDGGTPETSGQARIYGGWRTFVLTVKIVSNDQWANEAPGHLGSLLRTRLRRPEIQAQLNAADLAVARILMSRNDDFVMDSRWYSQTTIDILMNTVEQDDSDLDPQVLGDVILEVHGEGEPEIVGVDLDVGPV